MPSTPAVKRVARIAQCHSVLSVRGKEKMANKVYEIITQKIIEKLEQGTIPWKKPFRSAQAVNWETQKPYRGINTLLLEPGEYATFRNIQKHGGKVKKGEQAQIAVLWKWVEKKTDEHEEDGEKEAEKYPLLRYYRVFEINSQVEGLERCDLFRDKWMIP